MPPFDGGTETAVELLVRNQAVDNTISVEDVRTRMEEQYPLAVPAFEQALADSGVEASTNRVTGQPSRIKKRKAGSFTRPEIRLLRSRTPRNCATADDVSGSSSTSVNGRAFVLNIKGRFGVKLANRLPFGAVPGIRAALLGIEQ